MNTHPTFFPTASIAAAAILGTAGLAAAPGAHAQGVLRPIEAVVVNPTTRPVPVTVLSTPAQPGEGSAEIYRLAVPAGLGCSPQTVPAGKRLVLQHISGYAQTIAPAALLHVGIRTQPSGIFDLLVPAAPAVTVGTTNYSAAGQQVRAYFDGYFELCAALVGSDPGAAPLVSIRGYLVDKP